MVKLDRCAGSCNTLNGLSNKVCIPNKTQDLNLSMFNIITGRNESKTLTKHILCDCKCKIDGRRFNSDHWCDNVNVNVKVENVMYVKKKFSWNPATLSCENGKYLASIMDDLTIMCDEIYMCGESYEKETKIIPTNFNKKKAICKTQSKFYIDNINQK